MEQTAKRVGLRALTKDMGAQDLVDITTRVVKYLEKCQIPSSLRASYRKLVPHVSLFHEYIV